MSCGCDSNVPFDGVSQEYKKVLWIVIAINIVMFGVEMSASLISNSVALRADSLDFLGDSLTYCISLIAIGHSLKWRASAALFKGFTLLALGLWVLASTVYQTFILGVPNEFIMGTVAFTAFAANIISALLLYKFREGDANVRSVWLCSRNDAINNIAVMIAAAVVYLTQSQWPDLIVAFIMATLFLRSSYLIFRQALGELEVDLGQRVRTSLRIPK
ncbi:MAG: cation diffusion facilitator family transporter [Gammaproteobacteria bacterium]|jgi:cation diffusion facilitator family transporter